MWDFNVDQFKCIGCGRCVAECSRGCLEMTAGERQQPVPRPEAADKCFHCQHCLAVCPAGAVSIDGVRPEDCEAVLPRPAAEDMLRLMKSRRSCRLFRDKEVDRERLDRLEEVLAYAPTGVNLRTLRFIMVESAAAMDDLRRRSAELLLNEFENHPDSEISGKFGRMKHSLERKTNPIFRNAPHMLLVTLPEETTCFTTDPIIALSYFELYAQTLELGTLWCWLAVWLGGFFPELFRKIGMPENHKIGGVMLFGEPSWNFRRTVVRTLDSEHLVRVK